MYSIFLTGEAVAESYEKMQATGLGEDVSQLMAGIDLEELSKSLRKKRLEERRLKYQKLEREKDLAAVVATSTEVLSSCVTPAEHSIVPDPLFEPPDGSADEDPLHQSVQPGHGGAPAAGSESSAADAALMLSPAPDEHMGVPSPMDAAGSGNGPGNGGVCGRRGEGWRTQNHGTFNQTPLDQLQGKTP